MRERLTYRRFLLLTGNLIAAILLGAMLGDFDYWGDRLGIVLPLLAFGATAFNAALIILFSETWLDQPIFRKPDDVALTEKTACAKPRTPVGLS